MTFSHRAEPVVIHHTEARGSDTSPGVKRIDIGHVGADTEEAPVEVEGTLVWGKGETIVIAGTIASDAPTTLTVRSPSISHSWNSR